MKNIKAYFISNNQIRRAVLASTLFIVTALVAPALATDSTYVTDTSVVAYGARSMAMGRATAAELTGASSIFSNPAGSFSSSDWGFTSMSTQILRRVDYKLLSGTYNINDNTTLGIGGLIASTPAGYYNTDDSSSASASNPISYGDSTYALSFASKLNDKIQHPRSIGDLYFGAAINFLNKGFSGSNVSGYSGTGYSGNVGLILDNCVGSTFGASVNNLFSSLSWANGYTEQLPTTVKLAGSRKLMDNALTLAADADFSLSTTPMTLHGGVEYNPFTFLSARAGIDQLASTSGEDAGTVATCWTAGLGVNYENFSFDYAYRSDASLSDNLVHYFSISYAPAPEKKAVVTSKENNEDEISAADTNRSVSTENKNHTETSTKARALKEPVKIKKAASIDADLSELINLDR